MIAKLHVRYFAGEVSGCSVNAATNACIQRVLFCCLGEFHLIRSKKTGRLKMSNLRWSTSISCFSNTNKTAVASSTLLYVLFILVRYSDSSGSHGSSGHRDPVHRQWETKWRCLE